MLADLLGSKHGERVLLFLLVNESVYPSEIQKGHGVPLTPIQSILRKFEKAGILIQDSQGKKKLYRFNPAYPLLDELKALLKKGFIHLPPEEKRRLFSKKMDRRLNVKDDYVRQKRTTHCLEAFWSRLSRVQRISIQTQSAEQAFGEVAVRKENGQQLIFVEKGHWTPHDMDFSNVLRWSFDWSNGMIALEHLRYGPSRPVFLFHLAPIGHKTLQSVDSHLCRDDCYFGRIEFSELHIRFLWRILGPRKNEVLHHTYS